VAVGVEVTAATRVRVAPEHIGLEEVIAHDVIAGTVFTTTAAGDNVVVPQALIADNVYVPAAPVVTDGMEVTDAATGPKPGPAQE
jgi:hypothetical protein